MRRAPGPVAERYAALVAQGALTEDPAQRALAGRLDALNAALGERALAAKGRALGWLFGRRQKAAPIRGLYVWGAVGRGKSMLMDMFFAAAPVAAKRRQHFHAFMADVHERIRRAREAGGQRAGDPVGAVAAELATEIRLLCFDEFSVTDIADAMILGRLFTRLFELGVVLVATSNVAPDELYAGGINRGHFLPFVGLLKARTEIVRLEAAEDYRLGAVGADELYLTPLGPESDAAMDRAWAGLTGGDPGAPAELRRPGRVVPVPRAAGGAAWFGFAELCGRPLGAADYVALAGRYGALFLSDVPVFAPERRNEAKRFIALVDALYDAGTVLVISAAAEPADLVALEYGTEAFEFARTASRLTEMRSAAWLAAAGSGAGAGGRRPAAHG